MHESNVSQNPLITIDNDFVKALAEPARVEILRVLLVLGESNVKALSERLPQDRSVISRHLSLMEKSGFLKARKEGRDRLYAIDGEQTLAKAEQLVETIRQCLKAGCC